VVFLDKQGRVGVLVSHPAYPTTEYGGLVFVYMGPPGIEPLFPMYDIIDTRHRDDVVLPGMRLSGDYSVGLVKDCSSLRHSRTFSIRGICCGSKSSGWRTA
jgi:hypothetical protein